jgi:hypothetical protein
MSRQRRNLWVSFEIISYSRIVETIKNGEITTIITRLWAQKEEVGCTLKTTFCSGPSSRWNLVPYVEYENKYFCVMQTRQDVLTTDTQNKAIFSYLKQMKLDFGFLMQKRF